MNQNRIRKNFHGDHKMPNRRETNRACRYDIKNEDRNYIWLCGHLDNFNKEPFLFGFQAM